MRVGILGAGQLGQMLALAGYPLGITSYCYATRADRTAHRKSAGQVDHDSAGAARRHVGGSGGTDDLPASIVAPVTLGDLSDTRKFHHWASQVDVITYEWENFPAELVADLSEIRPTFPDAGALAITQDRWREKRLFNELEIPVTPFRLATSLRDIQLALRELESPLVLKSRTGGYDGKGQLVLKDGDSLDAAAQLLATGDVVIEQWVPFQTEVSIIGVRGRDGSVATYPLTENEHRGGILYSSKALGDDSSGSPELTAQAEEYVRVLLKHLGYTGALGLELFVVDGRLIANEIAPRVHNSGHWTTDGAETSQFENHIRAITGLPLGSTAQLCPSAMINLIGTVPERREILEVPGAHLHLYGKKPRPGRKLGHVTVTATGQSELAERLSAVEQLIDAASSTVS